MAKSSLHLRIGIVIGVGLMVFSVMAFYTFQVRRSISEEVVVLLSDDSSLSSSSSLVNNGDFSSSSSSSSSPLMDTFQELSSSKLLSDVSSESSGSVGCNLFSGKWVYDNESYPLYRGNQCSFMFEGVDCEKYGRKNLNYQNWKWKPHDCDLPRFNVREMLEKLRNKRVVFAGDSLNRNQWYSMVCLIDSAAAAGISRDLHFNKSLFTYKVFDYNVSIDFYWEPMLLESNCDDPVYHRVTERIISAEGIEKHGRNWKDADVLVFNSYIWWRQLKLKVLWGSFESSTNATYKDVELLQAYQMALKTWSEWLNNHVNRTKTIVFFVSSSPTHNKAEEWGKPKGHKCFYETEPIQEEGYWGMDSDPKMMELVEETIAGLRSRGFKAQMLNITQLSEYRKDAHPSMHRKFWDSLTEEQLTKPNYHTDCTHWCLPGVPDVWNHLLYAYLIQIL